jgi:hypothetical protein
LTEAILETERGMLSYALHAVLLSCALHAVLLSMGATWGVLVVQITVPGGPLRRALQSVLLTVWQRPDAA